MANESHSRSIAMLVAKRINIDAVQVSLDNLELQGIEATFVVLQFVAVERGLQLNQLLHHAEQIGSGAAGRINHGDLIQGGGQPPRGGNVDIGRLVIVHETPAIASSVRPVFWPAR